MLSKCESVPTMNSDEKEVDSPHRRLSSFYISMYISKVTREEFKDLRTSVEELTKVVNNLNQAIVKNSTTNGYTSQQPLCGAPLMVTSFSSPKNYPLGSPTNTNFMKIFNSPLEEKLTSPPTNERKKSAQQKTGLQIGRRLFKHKTEGNSSACYLNYNPMNTPLYDGRSSGIKIPDWIPVVFRPPPNMILEEIEAAVVAYIFGRNKDARHDGKEILIETDFTKGDRETLKTLVPKEMVDGEVLTLVACMLTFQQRLVCQNAACWFLPTVFAQYVLSWTTSPTTLMGFYKDRFMGRVEELTKVFVPINDGKLHWFLLVIDMNKKLLILLDFKKCTTTADERRRIARLVGIFREHMLLDNSFYQYPSTTPKPRISEFKIVEPHNIGQQATGSNDCGVWVATWMKECEWDDVYNIKVNDESRMRIAIDLVNNSYNSIKDQIIGQSFQNWGKIETGNQEIG